jgi:HEAT repeat protein
MSEVLSVLDEIQEPGQPITHELMERISGSSRSDGRLFAERLSQLPEARRIEILASLAHHAEEDFALTFDEIFRACLDDESAQVRRQAIEALWEDERHDLAPRLIELLQNDPSIEVRAAAAAQLGRFVFMAECDELSEARGEQVREALERVIRSEQEAIEVRRRAVESVAFINDDAVRQIIDRAYGDEHAEMRISAVSAMARSADPFWAETVQAELYSDLPVMRLEAVRACGEISLSSAIPTLVRMIANDRDGDVQIMAVWALGQIGGNRARRVLEQLLEGESPVLAEAAEQALEEMDLMSASLDLMVLDPSDQEMVEERGMEEREASDFRREFHRYADDDGDEDEGEDERDDEGDEDWPDEFLEIG